MQRCLKSICVTAVFFSMVGIVARAAEPGGAAVAMPATASAAAAVPADPAHNPLIWADVPDIAIMRVGKTYYMSSTTMHMSSGLPIMKSTDLVNWSMASYAYQTLADNEAMRLENGKHAYGAKKDHAEEQFDNRRSSAHRLWGRPASDV